MARDTVDIGKYISFAKWRKMYNFNSKVTRLPSMLSMQFEIFKGPKQNNKYFQENNKDGYKTETSVLF